MRDLATRLGLATLCLSLWLGGCGFRLAGTEGLPESLGTMRLVTNNFGETRAKALQSRLRQAGVNLVSAADASAVELKVSWAAPADRTLVSSASNGQTVQRITRELRFSLRDANGATLVANKTLTRQTDIQLDDDNLLASNQERAEVAVDLQRALFDQLIRQLNRI